MTQPVGLTKREFGDLFGVSVAQLERLFQQGMPHERGAGRRVVIPMPGGRLWYHNYLSEKARRAATPTDADDAKRRKLAAEAELAELDLAHRRGETVTVADAERIVADAFANVRARLTNLPARMAGLVVGAPTIQEAQARLQVAVVEVLDELRRDDGSDAAA